MHRFQLLRSGAARSFSANHFYKFPFSSFIATLGFLSITNSAFAQALIAGAEAVTMDSFTSVDSMLPSLPGVLIAGLALIFAIRERGCAKEFKSKLEDADFMHRKIEKEAAHYRAIFDHSNVGLWQVDLRGFTIYANAAMCELLGIANIEEIKDIPDRKFFDMDHLSRKNMVPSYQTVLVDKKGKRHEVYVSEQMVVHDADSMSIKVRTVVDVNRLIPKDGSDQQKNESRLPEAETAGEQSNDNFTVAA